MMHIKQLKLSKYYDNYEQRKIPHQMGPFDKELVPMFRTSMFERNARVCYHPTVVIQYAIAKYNQWCATREDSDLEAFKTCAKWLLKNAEPDKQNRFLAWSIPFGIRTPKIESPWISSLTQGQGISVLLRFYELAPNNHLEGVIHGIAQSFLVPIDKGGVISKMTKNRYFLQEAGNICILNGCIAALVGLLEYQTIFNNDQVRKIIDGTITYLEDNIHQYDLGWWSKYSTGLRFNIADKHYQQTHIKQLNYLGQLLQNETFIAYAKKWESHWEKKSNHRKLKLYRLVFLNMLRAMTLLRLDFLKYKKNKDTLN